MGTPTTVTEAATLSPKEKVKADKAADQVAGAVSGAAAATVQTGKDGAGAVGSIFSSFWDNIHKKGFFGAIGDLFSGGWEGLMGFLGMSGDKEKDKNGLNVGSLLGSVAGGGLGWMIGQAFGGGWLGTIFGLGAAAVGLIIGAQVGDQNINPLLNRPVRGTRESNAQAQALEQGKGTEHAVSKTQEVAATGDSSIDWAQVHNSYLAEMRQPTNGTLAFSQGAAVSYSPQQLTSTGYLPTPQTPVALAQNTTGPSQSASPGKF